MWKLINNVACQPLLLMLLLLTSTVFAQKPELVVQTGNTSHINAVAFSPDGNMLASGHSDNTVKLWDVSSGKELKTLSSGKDPTLGSVSSVAFSSDGKTLLALTSAGYGQIKLWDIATGKMRTIAESIALISSIALSPDGKTLAAGVRNGTVILFDVLTGAELRTLFGQVDSVESVAFSLDGKMLATGGLDHTIHLWDFVSGRLIRVLSGATTGASGTIAFSPDGRLLASTINRNSAVKLWDVVSGQEQKTLFAPVDFISSVTFSPDGKILASAGQYEDRTVKLWDVSTGQVLQSLPHASATLTVEFSPDGKTLASGGSKEGNIKLWDVVTGRKLKTLSGYSDWITYVASSLDGKTVASAGSRVIRLWDLADGQPPKSLQGHTSDITAMEFSSDSKLLASGSRDRTVKVWDVRSGKELSSFAGDNTWGFAIFLTFSTDGKTLISGFIGEPVTFFAPDGKSWTSTTLGGTLRLWDLAAGKEAKSYDGFDVIALSSDRNVLASTSKDFQGRADGSLKLLNISTGEQKLLSGHTNRVYVARFSPDGKALASASDDQTIRLWNVATGQGVVVGHTDMIGQGWAGELAFSPDGNSLALRSWDRSSTQFWDVTPGRQARPFRGSNPEVSWDRLASGKFQIQRGKDGRIDLFDFKTGESLSSLIALDENDWAVVTSNGQFDASPGAEKLMHYVLHTPERGYEVINFDQLKLRYYEPGLLQKLFNGEPLRDVSAFRDVRLTPDVQEVASSSQNPANTKRTIKLTNRGGGIGRVQVFVNDVERIEDARDAKLRQNPEAKEAFITFELKGASVIAGEQPRVKVIAWNYDSQAKDEYKGYISSRGTELVYHSQCCRRLEARQEARALRDHRRHLRLRWRQTRFALCR